MKVTEHEWDHVRLEIERLRGALELIASEQGWSIDQARAAARAALLAGLVLAPSRPAPKP